MINKPTVLSALWLAGCALAMGANEPGLFKAGSTTASDGWMLTYSLVAKPPLAPSQRIGIQTDVTHTDEPGRPPVFHRFFVDPANKIYFGYDVMLSPDSSGQAVVKFQRLSLRADQLPSDLGAAGFQPSGMPRFPTETYRAGQTIAIDVLQNPASGMKVVDYIRVTRDKTTAATSASVAKILGNPGAPVCLEVFSDFECPACKAFHETVLPVIVRDYVVTGKAYVQSFEFPLPMHAHSREAAYLATAAAQVGRYQPVGDALFHFQQVWGADGKIWDIVAPLLTPDQQKKVQALAKDPSILAQVQQDVDRALALKVNQTPTLFVVRGARRYAFPGPTLGNYAILKSLIDQLLK